MGSAKGREQGEEKTERERGEKTDHRGISKVEEKTYVSMKEGQVGCATVTQMPHSIICHLPVISKQRGIGIQ